jgi:hypothetical protein
MSKGYSCIMHIHTVSEEAFIKDIMISYEKNEKGEVVTKIKPQYSRSFSKIICRVQTRIPIALEKYETIYQMGRFTLRDEGRTIALGKILKYKPSKAKAAEEAKSASEQQNSEFLGMSKDGEEQVQKINEQTENLVISQEKKKIETVMLNLDTGELETEEQMRKRSMDQVDEDDDEDDDEED